MEKIPIRDAEKTFILCLDDNFENFEKKIWGNDGERK